MRRVVLLFVLLCSSSLLWAQEPMYVVNGTVVDSIDSIQQEDIETIEVLPADEQTIAQWGMGASEGVIVVRLRYDIPAHFAAEGVNNFTDYLSKKVKWSEKMPVERVSLRVVVDKDGKAKVGEVLQSTSRQFLSRVLRAIEQSPYWTPAMRDGEAVESTHLVNVQLPLGEKLPVERGVILL